MKSPIEARNEAMFEALRSQRNAAMDALMVVNAELTLLQAELARRDAAQKAEEASSTLPKSNGAGGEARAESAPGGLKTYAEHTV